ncbi:hypothetical protein ACP4OV_011296 [Aristida adscensionis]
MRCDELPPQIHNADVYAAHPAFLASVYPDADGRGEWFFFICRRRGLGGKRRLGTDAYCLVGEAGSCGTGAWYYCQSFRYHEDAAGSSAARETEWRMDEYGECDTADGGGAFDMVVCKVYPARSRALHERLCRDRAGRASTNDVKPPVLVQCRALRPHDRLLELRAMLLAASALVPAPATVALALSLVLRREAWNSQSTESSFCSGSEVEKEEREGILVI